MTNMNDEATQFVVRRLEKLRESRHLSQKELAELSGVGQPTISKIFSGEQRPGEGVLEKLCNAFGLTLAGVLEQIDPQRRHMVGYLATPLTALVRSAAEEAELKRVVEVIRRIAAESEFSDPDFKIYWPGDHTHPVRNSELKAETVYLKDRSTASTYDFLVILCADPSYGVGQENEIASQGGVPAVRLVPAGLSRMMLGSFLLAKNVPFKGGLGAGINFEEADFREALHWVRRLNFQHQALYARLNGRGFGERLRQLISDRSGNYQRFADDLGIALHYLHALMDEPIAVSNPSVRLLKRMSAQLRVSVGHLIGENEESDPIWIESNAAWTSWMLDGSPKDGGISLTMRTEWRSEYDIAKLEESVASSRKRLKAMTVADWQDLYKRKDPNGDRGGKLF
jgi:transcriptional regulator with XRE-family HTH domain